MTNPDFRALCEELNGLLEYISDISPHFCEDEINNLTNSARTALAEQSVPVIERLQEAHPFVVRHYTNDERPSIKGNGFDGLEIGEDRQEAEEFIAWINKRIWRTPPEAQP
jgi:hypothetical protein